MRYVVQIGEGEEVEMGVYLAESRSWSLRDTEKRLCFVVVAQP